MTGKTKLIRLTWDNLRSLAAASIGANYVIVGTPFQHPLVLLKLKNRTNQPVYVSDDGVNNKDLLDPGDVIVLDIAANKVSEGGLYLPKLRAIYVKNGDVTTPTTSSFIVTSWYAG